MGGSEIPRFNSYRMLTPRLASWQQSNSWVHFIKMECRTYYRKDIVSWSKFGWTSSDSGASLPLAFYFTGLHEQDRVCDFSHVQMSFPPSRPSDTFRYPRICLWEYRSIPTMWPDMREFVLHSCCWLWLASTLCLSRPIGNASRSPVPIRQFRSQTSWMCKKCT